MKFLEANLDMLMPPSCGALSGPTSWQLSARRGVQPGDADVRIVGRVMIWKTTTDRSRIPLPSCPDSLPSTRPRRPKPPTLPPDKQISTELARLSNDTLRSNASKPPSLLS